MKFDCRNNPSPPLGRCVDLDTGERIPFVFFLDEEMGEYERYATDAGGAMILTPDRRAIQTVKGRGRIRFVPFESLDYDQPDAGMPEPCAVAGGRP